MLDGRDLAVIVPLWRRTKHVERVAASIEQATPAARVVFVYSAGDQAVVDALLASPERADRLTLCVDGTGGDKGDYAKKINAGYRATQEPFVFTGADDLDFHDGWYVAARKAMGDFVRLTPLNEAGVPQQDDAVMLGYGVVGTNDLTNERTMRGEHSTHSLVARWYADCCAVFDKPGAIYAEQYWHDYCDDELVTVARSRGAYAHALDAHVEHLHPLAGKSEDDVTYRRGRAYSRISRRVFLERMRRIGVQR